MKFEMTIQYENWNNNSMKNWNKSIIWLEKLKQQICFEYKFDQTLGIIMHAHDDFFPLSSL